MFLNSQTDCDIFCILNEAQSSVQYSEQPEHLMTFRLLYYPC